MRGHSCSCSLDDSSTNGRVLTRVCDQLQHLVSDEVCLQVAEMYLAERRRGAAGGNLATQCVRAAWETSYQWKAERVMAEENCFKVGCFSPLSGAVLKEN